MAEIEEAIVARAKAVSAITSLIGTAGNARIHPQLPKNITYPAIHFMNLGYEPTVAMNDDPKLTNAIFRLNCYADSYSGSKALSRAVQDGFQRYRGTIGGMVVHDIFIENKNDIYDDQLKVYNSAIDIKIHFDET